MAVAVTLLCWSRCHWMLDHFLFVSAAAVFLLGNAQYPTPNWEPTWDMRSSTILMACNNSGLHDPAHAVQFAIVAYDWSNGKAVWANEHPMDAEKLLTKQAEMVLEADPGIRGRAPRVWVYRCVVGLRVCEVWEIMVATACLDVLALGEKMFFYVR